MDVDDDNSITTEEKSQNLRKLRKLIDDMENLDDEHEEFTDEWFAESVGFFYDIRKSFPDFRVILNPENLKSVEEAKLTAEENASQLEYEMETGGSLDVPAFWRFCIAVETIVQAVLKLGDDESDMDLMETFDQLTIPTYIK